MKQFPSGLRSAFRVRRKLFGAWTSLGHPSITEMFSRVGVNFIGLDLEHGTMDQEQAQRLIAASQAFGVPCLPRVSSHNGEQIRRLLDSGADGIIVPNVSSVEQVDPLVRWSLYAPEGERSFGVARAQGYGFAFNTYVKGWNARSILIPQIESAEGVAAAEEIAAHPRVDALMMGPYDISGSLGIPGQLFHPKVQKACSHVLKACRRNGKGCGTQLVEPSPQQIRAAFRAGYTFVLLASDIFILWKWGERVSRMIQPWRQRKE